MAKKKETEEMKLLPQSVNLDGIKNELTEYVDQKIQKIVDDKVKKEIVSEIDKANKRVIREKNRKIFYKNIIIIILLAVCVGLTYLLYDNGYFDKYFNKGKETVEKKSSSKKSTSKDSKKDEKKEPTLDELKDKYGYLINNIYIYENSDYLNEYYDGNLTTELKNYLALNLVDTSKLQEEDDYNILDTDTLKDKYKELFSNDYESKTFKYNGNTIRYITKMDSYITEEKINKSSSNIKREITNIEVVSDKEIKITTIEGKVNDNKVYNIISNDELGDYNNNLLDYTDRLNKITYVFKDNKLNSIEK